MISLSFTLKKTVYSPIELFDLGNQIVNATGEIVSRSDTGKQVMDFLLAALGKLNEATEREKANPKTVEIHEADARRDNILLMIRDTLRANVHNTVNDEACEAGKALFQLFNKVIGANLKRLGLGAETKAVKYLLEALDEEENKKRCAILRLEPVVADLAQTQARVESLYTARTESELQAAQLVVKKAMEAAVDALRRYLGHIDILSATQSQGAANIDAKVRAIITDVETVARARMTRTNNGSNAGAVTAGAEANKAA